MESSDNNKSSYKLSFGDKVRVSALETFLPVASWRVDETNQEEAIIRSKRMIVKPIHDKNLEPGDRPDYGLPFNKMDEVTSKTLDLLRYAMLAVLIFNEDMRMQVLAGYSLTGLAHSVYLTYYQNRFIEKINKN